MAASRRNLVALVPGMNDVRGTSDVLCLRHLRVPNLEALLYNCSKYVTAVGPSLPETRFSAPSLVAAMRHPLVRHGPGRRIVHGILADWTDPPIPETYTDEEHLAAVVVYASRKERDSAFDAFVVSSVIGA